jgi:hypothetical protein
MAGSVMMDVAAVPGNAAAVTPSDSTVLDCVGLYVGGTGNVVVETQQGQLVTFASVPGGSWIWLQIARVRAATSATSIVALW